METVKLFWKAKCPECGGVKAVGSELKAEGLPVYDYDLDTPDGLAEASYYGVMATPTIIIEDEKENRIASFSGKIPTTAEVKKTMSDSC